MKLNSSTSGPTCPRCGLKLSSSEGAGSCPGCLSQVIFQASHETRSGDSQRWEEPRRLGDYRLLDEIARGGMGIVYRARQISLDRTVAVKVMRDSALASDEEIRRFRVEAGAAAKLKHPNIVAIYEVGEQGGQHYFAMDLVEGPNLAQRVRENPLPPREAADLVAIIAEAVQHAHERGVLHRDLKPSNVLIDAEGQPFVTDFGLARSMEGESSLTLTGQVLGTPGYMPPEQAVGHGSIGPAADIYSLGAVLYYLLTSRAPFVGGTPTETLRHVVEQEPVPPHLVNPEVPRDLESVCLKCLAKRPSERYPSAADLGADLRRFSRGESTHARPSGSTERLWRWCRRKPTIASLVAVVFVLVLILAVGSPLVAYRMNRARHTADLLRIRAEAGEVSARRNLYAADMNTAQQALAESNYRRVRELLERHRPDVGQQDFREFEWRWLWNLAKHEETFSLALPSRPVAAVVSPDAKWLGTASLWREARIWNLATHQEIAFVVRSDAQLGMAFAPDNSLFVVPGTNGLVHVWDISRQSVRQILTNAGPIFCTRFLTDSRTLVLGGEKEVVIWRVGAAQPDLRFPVDPMNQFNSGFAVSPDDRHVATPGRGESIKVWKVEDGSLATTLHGLGWGVHDLAFSPVGDSLAAAGDPGVAVWEFPGAELRGLLTNHAASTYGVAFSPDGKQLASAGGDQTVRLWDAATLREIRTLRGHSSDIWSVGYAGDGSLLVSGSRNGEVKFWDPQADSTRRTSLPAPSPEALAWGFSSDSARFLSLHRNGTLHSWDADTLQEIPPVSVSDWKPSVAAFLSEKNLAALGRSDGRILVVQFGLGGIQTLGTFDAGPSVKWLEFSKVGDRLVVASDDSIVVWNIATAHVESRYSRRVAFPFYARPVALGPDGLTLAVGNPDGTVSVRDLSSASEKAFNPENFVNVRLAFSPDNRTLATLGADFTVSLWNRGTLQKLMEFQNVRSEPRFMAFSPNGRRLAIAGLRAMKLCDLETGQEVASFGPSEKGMIHGIAFSPDGTSLVVAQSDRFDFWHAPLAAKIDQAVSSTLRRR